MNDKSKRIKNLALTFVVIAVLVAVDQVIKFFVEQNLRPVGSVVLIPKFIGLNYVQNTGSMMGILPDSVVLLSCVSVILIVGLAVYIIKKRPKIDVIYCCIVAILSGGIGNIIDRIFRGYVVDYIEPLFVDFYVFNFADSLVTCASFLVVGYTVYQLIRDSKRGKTDD